MMSIHRDPLSDNIKCNRILDPEFGAHFALRNSFGTSPPSEDEWDQAVRDLDDALSSGVDDITAWMNAYQESMRELKEQEMIEAEIEDCILRERSAGLIQQAWRQPPKLEAKLAQVEDILSHSTIDPEEMKLLELAKKNRAAVASKQAVEGRFSHSCFDSRGLGTVVYPTLDKNGEVIEEPIFTCGASFSKNAPYFIAGPQRVRFRVEPNPQRKGQLMAHTITFIEPNQKQQEYSEKLFGLTHSGEILEYDTKMHTGKIGFTDTDGMSYRVWFHGIEYACADQGKRLSDRTVRPKVHEKVHFRIAPNQKKVRAYMAVSIVSQK